MRRFNSFGSISVLLLCAACSGAGDPGAASGAGDTNPELAGLRMPEGLTSGPAALLESTPVGEPTDEETTQAINEDGIPVVTVISEQKYEASATYDTQVLLNPGTDVIYPGSVLVGSSIDDGSYREVVQGTKNEITVSYGGLNGVRASDGGEGTVTGSFYPTLSNYRAFHNEILGQRFQGANSTYTLNAEEVSTESAFGVHFAAGVSFPAPGVTQGVKAHFDYENSSKMRKYMIRFAQTYYTVDVDQGEGAFLYRDFDVDAFEGYRPVYVSSMAYGRLGFMTLESSESRRVIEAGVSAILTTPSLAVEAEASFEVKAVQNSSNLNVTVIGSDQVVTTMEGFAEFLEEGGFSASSTGQIVAYKLRFVDDNSVANTIFNGEYAARSTAQSTGLFDVTAALAEIIYAPDDSGTSGELYGSITMKSATGDPQDLFRFHPDSTHVVYDNSKPSPYQGPTRSFTALSLADSFTIDTNVHEHDGLTAEDYTGSTPAKLADVLEETEPGVYAGEIEYTVNEGDDYVTFRIDVKATAKYPTSETE